MDTYGLVNAAFCKPDRTIGWDRGVLMPGLRQNNGDMGAVMVLAHEYGQCDPAAGRADQPQDTHPGRRAARPTASPAPTCRWVARGDSPRFALGTADGLNKLLAAVVAFRDPLHDRGASPGRDR